MDGALDISSTRNIQCGCGLLTMTWVKKSCIGVYYDINADDGPLCDKGDSNERLLEV